MKHFALITAAIVGCIAPVHAGQDEIRGEERAVVTSAPHVPPPLNRRHATKVLLDVEVKEHTKQLADGVSYTYWTFGDDAPGQFIRVREGDLVQTRISNHPDNSVAHNIDFHAATGPGGGGEASFVAPATAPPSPGARCARASISTTVWQHRGHASGQRHVRADPGRTEARHAQGRQGILHRAGRVLHQRSLRRAR